MLEVMLSVNLDFSPRSLEERSLFSISFVVEESRDGCRRGGTVLELTGVVVVVGGGGGVGTAIMWSTDVTLVPLLFEVTGSRGGGNAVSHFGFPSSLTSLLLALY